MLICWEINKFLLTATLRIFSVKIQLLYDIGQLLDHRRNVLQVQTDEAMRAVLLPCANYERLDLERQVVHELLELGAVRQGLSLPLKTFVGSQAGRRALLFDRLLRSPE